MTSRFQLNIFVSLLLSSIPTAPLFAAEGSTRGGTEAAEDSVANCIPEPEEVCVRPGTLWNDPASVSLDSHLRAIAESVADHRVSRPLLRLLADAVDRQSGSSIEAEGSSGGTSQKHNPIPIPIEPEQSQTSSSMPSAGSWLPLGPTNQPGRMTGLALDPAVPGTVYASAADGGLWKSYDSGGTWTAIGDGLETLAMGAIAIDPTTPRNILAGSGEGNNSNDSLNGTGLFRSTDGGGSWTKSTFAGSVPTGGTPTNIRVIQYDLLNPLKVYCAGDGGFYKSIDGGVNWTKMKGGLPSGTPSGTDLLIHPTNDQILYAAVGVFTGSSLNGIYKSTDEGASWIKLTAGLPSDWGNIGRISLALSKSQPQILFAGLQDGLSANLYALRGLYKSTDGGATWTLLPYFDYCTGSTGAQCWYNNNIAVDPSNSSRVYLGGIDIHRSTDGGNSWLRVSDGTAPIGSSAYVHHDQHQLLVPSTGVLWTASDGGISRSTDSGATWSLLRGTMNLGESLETAQFYSVTLHQTDPNQALLGGQDVGTQRFAGVPQFQTVYGGDGIDGFATIFDPVDSTISFGEDVHLQVKRFTNGGATVTARRPTLGASEGARFNAPFVMDPLDHNFLYCGSQRVWRANDNLVTNSWVDLSGYFPTQSEGAGSTLSALAIAPSNPNRIYVGSSGGSGSLFTTMLYTTTNARTSSPPAAWVSLMKAPLPTDKTISRIVVHPTNEQTVYVSFRTTTNGSRIFKTTDAGGTWVAASSGLPLLSVNALIMDPTSPSTLLAGLDSGLYRTSDGGATWSNFGTSFGLPAVRIDDIAFNPTTGVLRAATHGRGMWQFVASASNPKEAAADQQMKAKRNADNSIQLTFTPACGATQQAVYRGVLPIAAAVTWSGQDCAVGATSPAAYNPPEGNLYFVLVGESATLAKEGSYGKDSGNFEIPPKSPGCFGQDLTGSCP